MTRIYVDAEAVAVHGASGLALDPGAVRSLQILADAGHEVVVVAGNPGAVAEVLRQLATAIKPTLPTVPRVPTGPTARAWYLTTAVERCQGVSAKVRTVLIGAAPAPGSIHRCDAVARDIQAAALEILASEAMPSR
ncbi:MAG: hypothetical protein HY263_07210 [Chloroflexi bacterium]|nr:hypothetical protein [Chloroflexota bacterium]